MARRKKQVPPELSITVYHYFRGNWDRHENFLKDSDMAHRSKDALDEVRDL